MLAREDVLKLAYDPKHNVAYVQLRESVAVGFLRRSILGQPTTP